MWTKMIKSRYSSIPFIALLVFLLTIACSYVLISQPAFAAGSHAQQIAARSSDKDDDDSKTKKEEKKEERSATHSSMSDSRSEDRRPTSQEAPKPEPRREEHTQSPSVQESHREQVQSHESAGTQTPNNPRRDKEADQTQRHNQDTQQNGSNTSQVNQIDTNGGRHGVHPQPTPPSPGPNRPSPHPNPPTPTPIPPTPDPGGDDDHHGDSKDHNDRHRHHRGYPYDYDPYPTVIIIEQPYPYPAPTIPPVETAPSEKNVSVPGSIDEAAHDIKAGWELNEIDLIMYHIEKDHTIDVYIDTKYSHSLTADEFYTLTLEAMQDTHTEQLEIRKSWRHRADGSVSVVHRYTDEDGNECTAKLIYRLARKDKIWYIRRIDLEKNDKQVSAGQAGH